MQPPELMLAVAATAVIVIFIIAYFKSTWFRNSFWGNFHHYLIATFTLMLVVFACYAWLESRRGSAALEGQLAAAQLDQRPLIWVIDEKQPRYDDASRQFKWDWVFANIGKGIAYRVVALDYLKIGNERYQRSYGGGSNAKVLEPPSPTIMPPIVPSFPYLLRYHTASSRPGIDKDYFNKEMGTDSGIGLLVDFEYYDAGGKIKFTNSVCIEQLSSGAHSYQSPDNCPKGQ